MDPIEAMRPRIPLRIAIPMGNLRASISVDDVKNEVLTVGEVAAFLKLTKATIYKWVARGDIRAFYVGSLVRITKVELVRFLAEGAAKP